MPIWPGIIYSKCAKRPPAPSKETLIPSERYVYRINIVPEVSLTSQGKLRRFQLKSKPVQNSYIFEMFAFLIVKITHKWGWQQKYFLNI